MSHMGKMHRGFQQFVVVVGEVCAHNCMMSVQWDSDVVQYFRYMVCTWTTYTVTMHGFLLHILLMYCITCHWCIYNTTNVEIPFIRFHLSMSTTSNFKRHTCRLDGASLVFLCQ